MIETNVNERAWNSHLGCTTNGPQLAKSDYAAREDRIYDLGFGEQHAPLPASYQPNLKILGKGDALMIDGQRLTVKKHDFGPITRQRIDGTPFRYCGSFFLLSDGSDKTWDELVCLFLAGRLVDLRDEKGASDVSGAEQNRKGIGEDGGPADRIKQSA